MASKVVLKSKSVSKLTLRETVFHLEVCLKKLAYLEVLLDMWKTQTDHKDSKKKIADVKKKIQGLEKRKEDLKERIFLLCGKKN